MATGDSNDILDRVLRVIPRRWFQWGAFYRNALIGGLADSASWLYGFVFYVKSQTRIATASGLFLDLIAFDFLQRFIKRGTLSDQQFQALISATILQERVTRAGMISALTKLTGNVPQIFEPWNTFDTGAYSNKPTAIYGSMGYGVGRGGYGNMDLNNQVFVRAFRGAGSGIPTVNGYGGYQGGYGVGAIEYIGTIGTWQQGVGNNDINNLVKYAKPTGVTVWLEIG